MVTIYIPVLDEQGNQINRNHRCFIRAHLLGTKAAPYNFWVIVDRNLSNTPFVYSWTQDYYTTGDRVTFQPREAADPKENLTVSTPYALRFGSGKFWESNFGADQIVQKGTSISDCGTFLMEETKDPDVDHQAYKLVYYRGTYEVSFEPSIGNLIYQMVTTKTPSNLAFSFYQCRP